MSLEFQFVHSLPVWLNRQWQLDYIPEPASSIPIKKPPAAGTSTLEVMADVHKGFGDVDSGSGEVEVLERTQEGNQATQF